MLEKIAIIGAGDLGSTLGKLLEKKYSVKYWDKNSRPGIKLENKMADTITNARAVLLCIPTSATKEIIGELKKYLNKQAIVITFSKGLNRDGQTVFEYLKKQLKNDQPIVYVGGSMLFAEITEGKNWWPLICGQDKKACNYTAKMFYPVKAQQVGDIVAGAVGGTVKNCYVLAMGMALEVGWGYNTIGRLMAKAITEINFIVSNFANKKDLLIINDYVVADFLSTSLSPHSKNRSAGRAISKGRAKAISEGTASIASLVKRLGDKKIKKLPLLQAINKIVNNKKNINSLLEVIK